MYIFDATGLSLPHELPGQHVPELNRPILGQTRLMGDPSGYLGGFSFCFSNQTRKGCPKNLRLNGQRLEGGDSPPLHAARLVLFGIWTTTKWWSFCSPPPKSTHLSWVKRAMFKTTKKGRIGTPDKGRYPKRHTRMLVSELPDRTMGQAMWVRVSLIRRCVCVKATTLHPVTQDVFGVQHLSVTSTKEGKTDHKTTGG